MQHDGYQAGDLVVVREWDDLCSEFDKPSRIGFMDSMRRYCGQTMVIRNVYNSGVFELGYPDTDEKLGWCFSSSMIRLLDDQPEVRIRHEDLCRLLGFHQGD